MISYALRSLSPPPALFALQSRSRQIRLQARIGESWRHG
jgi:hypothetical protein